MRAGLSLYSTIVTELGLRVFSFMETLMINHLRKIYVGSVEAKL